MPVVVHGALGSYPQGVRHPPYSALMIRAFRRWWTRTRSDLKRWWTRTKRDLRWLPVVIGVMLSGTFLILAQGLTDSGAPLLVSEDTVMIGGNTYAVVELPFKAPQPPSEWTCLPKSQQRTLECLVPLGTVTTEKDVEALRDDVTRLNATITRMNQSAGIDTSPIASPPLPEDSLEWAGEVSALTAVLSLAWAIYLGRAHLPAWVARPFRWRRPRRAKGRHSATRDSGGIA